MYDAVHSESEHYIVEHRENFWQLCDYTAVQRKYP
jgi:hypothetical protein